MGLLERLAELQASQVFSLLMVVRAEELILLLLMVALLAVMVVDILVAKAVLMEQTLLPVLAKEPQPASLEK